MKKYLLILAGALVLSACSKEQLASNEESINVSELSTNVTNFIAENYPDATITSALRLTKSEATTVVILSTTEELAFNNNGECLGDALNYRGGNGGGRGGHHGGGPGGHHGGGPGGGHHGGGPGGHLDSMGIDTLLPLIVNYIDSNYATYKVMNARFDTTCEFGKVISVMVGNRSFAGPVKLVFDLNGVFLFSGQRFPYSGTPQIVKDYFSTNYAGYKVRTVAEKLSLASSIVEYNVFIADSTSRKMITIKEDGTFVCLK